MSRKKTEINPVRAERVKKIIELEGISQQDFAKRIPMTQQNVSRIVNQKVALTEETAKDIVEAFPKYRVEWLLGYEDNMTLDDKLTDVASMIDDAKAVEIMLAIRAGTAHAFLNENAINGAIDKAICALEKQEQDMWIPVTERLPELDTEVLTTDQYGDVLQATYIEWCGSERFVSAEESITIEDVIAWKPLPEPYQEDKA